ncbi:MAG: SPOR domain-containing protein [Aestuariivirga sp.]|uniref:SPOR domain-containing protein n=1 Tax=Aestuariivirga sp. TaxID=2650926 RepID=UPI0030162956
MDQDSSNGAGPDKRNWRERLGIGAKELPKLSDEFRDEPQMSAPPPAGTARPAPRAPVTKPAPMAPRVKPAQPGAESPATASPSVPPALSRATPRAPDNAAQDALAEKLRAQRAAAERLAEQRVQAARNRAEGKKPEAPVPQRPAAPPLRPAAPTPRNPVVPPTSGAPRPKFSFADDRGEQRPGGAAPLTPPRPALGGDRSPPPFLRPSTNGNLGARPQPAFRPTITEGGSGYVPSPRLPGVTRPGLGADAAGYGASRLPVRRTPPINPYARQPEPPEYPEDVLDEEGRAAPRLGRPVGRAREDDFDEVFEDDAAPRGRASARDYQSEYAEGEEGFADEPRRSSGPWLLLLALLGAAVLVGGLVWYYSDNMKNLAGVGSSSSSGSTPVVPAPADPAKVAAPDASGDSQTEAPAARKKQIYDRIVGEQEVTGEMQPTEETPVAPEAAQPDAATPAAAEAPAADQVPKIEPAGNANTIPVPDAPTQGTGQGLPEVEPPLPLPIPGSDQQGNLGLKDGSQVAATSAQPDQGGAAPPPLPATSSQTSSSDANTPPPPEKATDGAALVSGAASTASATAATAATEPVVTAPPPSKPAQTQAAAEDTTPPPPKKKTPAKKTVTKQTASKQADYNNLGTKPVVLVPPSQQGGASDQNTAAATQPLTTAPATAEQPVAPANPQKRKTIFDLFNVDAGGSAATTARQAAPTQVASAATQTKQATAPAAQQKAATPPAAAAPQASTGGGYVVQLASFRTDTEAKKEYSRLAGAYPSVVGPLKSQIRQATVGGSTRYQLGLGPLPTRGDATRVCSELIAAGESDCIVRGP